MKNDNRDDLANVHEAGVETLYESRDISDNITGALNLDLEDFCDQDG